MQQRLRQIECISQGPRAGKCQGLNWEAEVEYQILSSSSAPTPLSLPGLQWDTRTCHCQPMWVPGTELQSSSLASCAFTQRAILLAHIWLLEKSVLLYCPGWPETHNLSASVSRVLRLQARTATPSLCTCFLIFILSSFNILSISILLIPVIYTTVLINKKKSTYFSCVVFLSIVVNHLSDKNPYFFVFNRVLDTMIGIVIALVINTIKIPFKK